MVVVVAYDGLSETSLIELPSYYYGLGSTQKPSLAQKSEKVGISVGVTLESVIEVDKLSVLPIASGVHVFIELDVSSLIWRARRFKLTPSH